MESHTWWFTNQFHPNSKTGGRSDENLSPMPWKQHAGIGFKTHPASQDMWVDAKTNKVCWTANSFPEHGRLFYLDIFGPYMILCLGWLISGKQKCRYLIYSDSIPVISSHYGVEKASETY